MVKKNIISFSLAFICAMTGTLLLAFVVPENVPVLVGFDEKIAATGSKWWVLLLCFAPLLIALLQAFLQKKCGAFIFQYLIMLFIYENVFVLIYLCLGNEFAVGDILALPLSLLIFLPLSFSIMVWAIKIKFVPYKSPIGIRIKYTLKSDFIWKQTHFLARDIFFFGGFLLAICSLIFSCFHVTWIEIPIFAAMLAICFAIVVNHAGSMYKKLMQMEKNKENLDKNKKSV